MICPPDRFSLKGQSRVDKQSSANENDCHVNRCMRACVRECVYCSAAIAARWWRWRISRERERETSSIHPHQQYSDCRGQRRYCTHVLCSGDGIIYYLCTVSALRRRRRLSDDCCYIEMIEQEDQSIVTTFDRQLVNERTRHFIDEIEGRFCYFYTAKCYAPN